MFGFFVVFCLFCFCLFGVCFGGRVKKQIQTQVDRRKPKLSSFPGASPCWVLLSRALLACHPPHGIQPTRREGSRSCRCLGLCGQQRQSLTTAGQKCSCHGIRCSYHYYASKNVLRFAVCNRVLRVVAYPAGRGKEHLASASGAGTIHTEC